VCIIHTIPFVLKFSRDETFTALLMGALHKFEVLQWPGENLGQALVQ
jgi:hypothetical protein